MKTPEPETVYQLKVTLAGSKPAIWRRLLVPGAIRLSSLHDVLQIAMGWGNCHLHEFRADGLSYGTPEEDWGSDVLREGKFTLDAVLTREKQRMEYVYDFGDDWRHKIVVEKIRPRVAGEVLPRCVKGAGACPPEDCGGIWGYASLLETLADPSDPEYAEMMEWAGGPIDPEHFDIEAVNKALAPRKRKK